MSWSNLEGAAGAFEAGRKVTPELTGVAGLAGVGGRHVTPELTGAAGLAGVGGRHVTPELTDVAFGALKGEAADVVPLITGAAGFGALKGEAADVVPRITGVAAFDAGATFGEGRNEDVVVRGRGGMTKGPLKGEGAGLRSGVFVVLGGIAARLAWFRALITSCCALARAAASALAASCCALARATPALFCAIASRVLCEIPGAFISAAE
jgi:hypothetical protein